MHNTIRFILMLVIVLGAIGLVVSHPTPTANAQSDSDVANQLSLNLNSRLIENGIRPLARNTTLDSIAQTIADELGATGAYTSLPRVLADELGYPRWPDGGQRVINQAFNVITPESPDFFVDMFAADIIELLESTFYREIGVGISTRVAVEGGTEQTVYTIVMGAQPNVLPVVIDNGDSTIYMRQVDLYIHNEFSLAYETESDIIVRAREIRIANSEAELEDAEWQVYEPDPSIVNTPWTLSEEYGDKSVWVEFRDDTGFTVRSSASVTYADPATAPSPEVREELPRAQLVMTYGDDTFTLRVVTERSSVNLQELYFTWIDGLRAYELENAEALSDVTLEQIIPNTCIQIRLRDLPAADTEGCDTIILEAEEFNNIDRVFWNPAFEAFAVFNGPDVLGVCDSTANECTIQIQ